MPADSQENRYSLAIEESQAGFLHSQRYEGAIFKGKDPVLAGHSLFLYSIPPGYAGV